MSNRKSVESKRKPKTAQQLKRAAADFAGGDFAAAAKACRKLVRVEPRAADIWHLLAASLLRRVALGDRDDAVQRLVSLERGPALVGGHEHQPAGAGSRGRERDDPERAAGELPR